MFQRDILEASRRHGGTELRHGLVPAALTRLENARRWGPGTREHDHMLLAWDSGLVGGEVRRWYSRATGRRGDLWFGKLVLPTRAELAMPLSQWVHDTINRLSHPRTLEFSPRSAFVLGLSPPYQP
eukprot:3588886-Rhodomonas_salina.1